MRDILLWLHIIGAGTWLGANITQAFVGPKLMANRETAPGWLRAVQSASGPLYGIASGLILITGIVLVLISDGAYEFSSVFVTIGFAVVIIGGALAGLVFNKKTRQMIGLYESGQDAQVPAIYRSVGTWGILDSLLIVVATLAMVSKWGP
ncbi:MAG: hypothetical protein ACR2ME_09165 [Acidimicrobiia bacterium]